MDPKQIHLRQLDLTREVSGLVFAKEPHKYLSLLAIQMDMQLCH